MSGELAKSATPTAEVEVESVPTLWVLGGPKVPEKLSQDDSKWETTKLSSYFQPISASGSQSLWVHNQEKIARWYVDNNLTRDQTSVEPARHLFAHALLGHKLYIMGGEKLSITGGERKGRAALKDCLVYEFNRRIWSKAPDLPRETSGRNAVVIQNTIYLTCGRNGDATGQMDIFDPKVNEWRTAKGQMVIPRYGHATAATEGHVWVLGGQTQDGNVLPDVERFDLTTEEWQTICPMNVPRTKLSATLYKGNIYAVGGKKYKPTSLTDGQAGLEICCDVEIFDPARGHWTSGPKLNFPRAGHGSVILWRTITDCTTVPDKNT